MKKIIALISVILLFAVSINAQRSGSTTTLLPQQTYKVLTMLPVDSVQSLATAYWVFALNKPKTQYYAVAIQMDCVGTTTLKGHTWINTYGSIDGTTWVNTGFSTIKYGGTADSTMVIYDVSTGILWKYLKVAFVGKKANGGVTTFGNAVRELAIKVGDK